MNDIMKYILDTIYVSYMILILFNKFCLFKGTVYTQFKITCYQDQ